MDDERKEDFSNMPLKTEFTINEILEPWKKVSRLEFLLGLSVVLNLFFALFIIIR